jgi:hypothetical protein
MCKVKLKYIKMNVEEGETITRKEKRNRRKQLQRKKTWARK